MENHDRIVELKRKISILEWDKNKNQLNSGKEKYLNTLKDELKKLRGINDGE